MFEAVPAPALADPTFTFPKARFQLRDSLDRVSRETDTRGAGAITRPASFRGAALFGALDERRGAGVIA